VGAPQQSLGRTLGRWQPLPDGSRETDDGIRFSIALAGLSGHRQAWDASKDTKGVSLELTLKFHRMSLFHHSDE
jgi:hypothetical protein